MLRDRPIHLIRRLSPLQQCFEGFYGLFQSGGDGECGVPASDCVECETAVRQEESALFREREVVEVPVLLKLPARALYDVSKHRRFNEDVVTLLSGLVVLKVIQERRSRGEDLGGLVGEQAFRDPSAEEVSFVVPRANRSRRDYALDESSFHFRSPF